MRIPNQDPTEYVDLDVDFSDFLLNVEGISCQLPIGGVIWVSRQEYCPGRYWGGYAFHRRRFNSKEFVAQLFI